MALVERAGLKNQGDRRNREPVLAIGSDNQRALESGCPHRAGEGNNQNGWKTLNEGIFLNDDGRPLSALRVPRRKRNSDSPDLTFFRVRFFLLLGVRPTATHQRWLDPKRQIPSEDLEEFHT